MAKRSRAITMSPLILDQEDDLDLWEVVSPSDGDFSDDSFSVDSLPDDDVISLDDASFVSPPQILPVADSGDIAVNLDLHGHVDDDGEADEVDDNDLGWAQRRMMFLGGDSRYSGVNVNGDDGDEDVEYEDSYDLDDELVPRSVTKKLERERMRKLGKRAFAKVYTSKTSLYSQLKPGCIRGKHGLGLKFEC